MRVTYEEIYSRHTRVTPFLLPIYLVTFGIHKDTSWYPKVIPLDLSVTKEEFLRDMNIPERYSKDSSGIY